ncbi:MAG: four helix bundle protein [Gemmatimonadales bacterium]
MRWRTRTFALRVMRLAAVLEPNYIARTIGRQILRSGTSVGANYLSACRARSKREFVARLGIVIEEAEETLFWLEMLRDGNLIPESRLGALIQEANELVSILVVRRATARTRG